MQKFDSESNNVSSEEAQEILAAWTNRRQAQGIDPGVGSVPALAAGLGVSEDEIRHMLEDIRVQKRSHEIAAGIIGEQQKHRKRSDVTAAAIAAAVLVLFVLIGGALMMFRGNAAATTLPPPGSPAPVAAEAASGNTATAPTAPTPVPPGHPDLSELGNVLTQDDTSVVHTSGLHGITNIDQQSYIRTDASGTSNLSGRAATDAMKKRIQEGQEIVNELKSKSELSSADEAELEYWNGTQGELRALQIGLQLHESQTNTP